MMLVPQNCLCASMMDVHNSWQKIHKAQDLPLFPLNLVPLLPSWNEINDQGVPTLRHANHSLPQTSLIKQYKFRLDMVDIM